MKRLIQSMMVLSMLLLGCSIVGTATPTAGVGPLASSATPYVDTTPAPVIPTATATQAPVIAANVICNELSLHLDAALASGYNCQTIPEAAGPDTPNFGINPQYTEVTLQGYLLADTFHKPHISVFPVQRFQELIPGLVDQRLTALQGLTAGAAPSGTLPLLPIFNAAQQFYAQYQGVPFANGSGIRYLSQYNQYSAPVNNRDLFYTFQGLTGDGAYWISVVLPVSNPLLPANPDNPPNGLSWEEFGNGYDAYLAGVLSQLNAQAPGTFSPDLAALDALVASIRIQP